MSVSSGLLSNAFCSLRHWSLGVNTKGRRQKANWGRNPSSLLPVQVQCDQLVHGLPPCLLYHRGWYSQTLSQDRPSWLTFLPPCLLYHKRQYTQALSQNNSCFLKLLLTMTLSQQRDKYIGNNKYNGNNFQTDPQVKHISKMPQIHKRVSNSSINAEDSEESE